MLSVHHLLTPRRLAVVIFIGCCLACTCLQAPVRAAEPVRYNNSLDLVPADAAFYGALLRNREQIEAVLNSRAWARLNSLPAVQAIWKQSEALLALADAGGNLRKLLEQPENGELIELLKDMCSNEVFIYGGKDAAGFVDLLVQTQGAVSSGPAILALTGQADKLERKDVQAVLFFRALAGNTELLKTPDMVVGFKVSKADGAERQIKRLEELLKGVEQQVPQLKGRLKRVKIGQNEFLTWSLDGSLVPWDQIPFKDFESAPGEFDDLVKKLKALKLTISVGMRDGYLLLATGSDTQAIARFGQGKRLSEIAEFKPLAKFANNRLTSIRYASKAIITATAVTKKDVDDWMEIAKGALKEVKLTDEQRKRIDKDLAALTRDIKELIPESGPSMSFSYLTGRGYESYSYDWSAYKDIDGSRSLPLLNHVGGDPVLAVVSRAKYQLEQYQMLVKWLKIGHGYFEEIAVPMFKAEHKTQYQKIAKAVIPLLKRLDEATGKMVLPALADGQTALVIDVQLRSKQWIKLISPADKALPMIEPALVVGVSDAVLLKKGCAEYFAVTNDLLARIRELAPAAELPELKIPDPQIRKAKSGTLYSFPLPTQWGLERQLAPTAGLSDKVGVLTISESHAERLLTSTPLKTKSRLLADPNRKLASAVYFNWPALVDGIVPWVEYGVTAYVGRAQEQPAPEAAEPILQQVRVVAEVLKVFRSYTSITYLEDKALVTRSEIMIEDLPK